MSFLGDEIGNLEGNLGDDEQNLVLGLVQIVVLEEVVADAIEGVNWSFPI